MNSRYFIVDDEFDALLPPTLFNHIERVLRSEEPL